MSLHCDDDYDLGPTHCIAGVVPSGLPGRAEIRPILLSGSIALGRRPLATAARCFRIFWEGLSTRTGNFRPLWLTRLEGVVGMLSQCPETSVVRARSAEQASGRQLRPNGHGVAVRQVIGPIRVGLELVVEL
jgi:hypothetical protein